MGKLSFIYIYIYIKEGFYYNQVHFKANYTHIYRAHLISRPNNDITGVFFLFQSHSISLILFWLERAPRDN